VASQDPLMAVPAGPIGVCNTRSSREGFWRFTRPGHACVMSPLSLRLAGISTSAVSRFLRRLSRRCSRGSRVLALSFFLRSLFPLLRKHKQHPAKHGIVSLFSSASEMLRAIFITFG
jgi:hypothetical protein